MEPQQDSLGPHAGGLNREDRDAAEHAGRRGDVAGGRAVIGPPLVRHVLVQAPAVTLHVAGWHESVYHDVERGALDLAFTGGAAPPPLRSEPLFDDRYVCVMSAGHPLAANGALTLGDYLDCDHVVVDVLTGRQGTVDTRLRALGRARRASVTVPYHALAAAAIRETRLVATMLRRLAGHLTAD